MQAIIKLDSINLHQSYSLLGQDPEDCVYS